MNLHDCRVPYVALPSQVLKLQTKAELLHAIEIYHTKIADRQTSRKLGSLFTGGMSPYLRRQRMDVLASLERAGVIHECEDRDGYKLLPTEDIPKDRINIPAQFDYKTLSSVGLKTAIACHAVARYSRTPFRFTINRADLAEKAEISERRLRDALVELERCRYLEVEKVWREGTRITLCEPGSGAPLYYLGEYQQQRVDVLPVFDRYKYLLARYDPKQKLAETRGPVHSYRVHCPFCKFGASPTFSFTSEQDDDHWTCHNCRRSGDSYRLWGRLSNWKDDTDWRQIIAASDVLPPPSPDFPFDLGSMVASEETSA